MHILFGSGVEPKDPTGEGYGYFLMKENLQVPVPVSHSMHIACYSKPVISYNLVPGGYHIKRMGCSFRR